VSRKDLDIVSLLFFDTQKQLAARAYFDVNTYTHKYIHRDVNIKSYRNE